MESHFFRNLSALQLRGNFVINVRIGDGDKLQVSILLGNPAVKDKVANSISPMVLEGTPTEMDNGFFTALKEPLNKTNQFFLNAIQHQQSLESATKKSQQSTTKTPNDASKRKFEERMKKVTELEQKQKFGEAIAQMPTTKDFPEFEKQITVKLSELRSKHGSLSLFAIESTPISGDDTRETVEDDENPALEEELNEEEIEDDI